MQTAEQWYRREKYRQNIPADMIYIHQSDDFCCAIYRSVSILLLSRTI